jgi:GrpB-like predicted nucleotidyltransferase (UPF0157 family)
MSCIQVAIKKGYNTCMDIVHLKLSQAFADEANALYEKHRLLLQKLFPTADIQHIGGTSVPGLLTKGDLDINVRIDQDQFHTVAEKLKNMYEINQPENWSDVYASFKNDSLNLGIQVTVVGSDKDFFVFHRDALQRDPKLVTLLNELKAAYEGKSMEEYRGAKGAFLETHITYRPDPGTITT